MRVLFERAIYAANWLGSMWIFVMMLIVVFDVAMRYLGRPVSGPKEVIEASIVVILYLQIAHTLKAGRVTRSDAFFTTVRRRVPLLGRAMGCAFNLAGAGLVGVIVYKAWPRWLQSYHGDFFIGIEGIFRLPEWPVRFVLFAGCLLLAIQFLLNAWDALRGRKDAAEEAGGVV